MKIPYSFTPIEEFKCEETGQAYMTGLSYNVRVGNTDLHRRVQKWREQNKVILGRPKPAGLVSGKAQVSD